MIYIGFELLLAFLILLNNKKKYVFNALFFLFSLLLIIRFGQGTDYFNYKTIFSYVSDDFFRAFRNVGKYNDMEPSFLLINIIGKRIESFTFVIAVSAFISVYFIYKTIKQYSKNYLFSFFLFFTNYIVYLHSGIRQGIAMSIILYAFLEYLYTKKKKRYYLYCLLAISFHTSSVICLFFPFILRLKFLADLRRYENFVFYTLLFSFCGVILFKIMMIVLGIIMPKYSGYSSNSGKISIGAFLVRFLLAIVLIYISRKNKDKDSLEYKLLSIYLFGILMYCFSMTNAVASRVTDYFSMFEIILISNTCQIRKNKKYISCNFILIIVFFSSLLIKDLQTFEIEGVYPSKNPFNYPYISIYQKERIYYYRPYLKDWPKGLVLDEDAGKRNNKYYY